MDALSAFTAADLLWLDFVTASYSDEAGHTRGLNVQNRCVPKLAGSLDLSLNASEFGYPEIGVPILFHGTAIGPNAKGLQQVRWTVDQMVDVYIPGSSPKIKIKSIKGQLTAVLALLDEPKERPVCGGNARCHPFNVNFNVGVTGDAPNEFAIAAAAEVEGLPSRDVTARITAAVMVGSSAENLSSLSVSIKEKKSWKCWAGPVAGTSQVYWAVASGVPTGAKVTYSWEVAGATIDSSTNDMLVLKVPDPPHPFSITVTATVDNIDACAATRRITLMPLTADEAAFMESICALIDQIRQAGFRGSPWRGPDPVALAGVRPLDLLGIRAAAVRVGAAATRLVDVGANKDGRVGR